LVLAAVFWAEVFFDPVPLPVALIDEAAFEDLDFAVGVFFSVAAEPVFLVVVALVLAVVDFALVVVDFDLAAALAAFGAAGARFTDGDAGSFEFALISALADSSAGDWAGAGFCGDAFTAFAFELDGLEEGLDLALSGDTVDSSFSASSNP
jgi:hypothetical protein